MKSSDIRQKFLKYFESKGHKIRPGSSLVPNDPTVLLTLAGMLQFKPIFLGTERAKYKRVTTIQKCIRMNDIENVGRTARHQTFFEMLGNFSFGDYFKKEAISFAWEFLTVELGLPQDRLHIAVFEKDEEAYRIWKEDMHIPEKRLYKLGEENNFWAAGPTGPCGPCSELYYDLGVNVGCKRPDCAPGCDCDRFLEIWNLVFMQYNRDEKGVLHDLSAKNIDTGMGLERIASILQSVPTNFGTDLFKPILDALSQKIKVNDEKLLDSKNIIADHIRAIVHLMSDNVIPSNEGRGYVLRRLIRRAVRHGKLLGINDPFLYELAFVVAEINGTFYPEVNREIKYVSQTIKMEEEHFGKTLQSGIEALNKIIKSGVKMIPGKEVFSLHDTFGFPIELTKEIAEEAGVAVDNEGFKKLMGEQKEKGRTSGIANQSKFIIQKLGTLPNTKFIGYNSITANAKIIHIDEDFNAVVLEKTPFYPDSGGQMGDTGKFIQEGKEYEVIGTYGQTSDGVIAHQLKSVQGLKRATVKAVVDCEKRRLSSAHHTATHILHAALREAFGKGVKQAGSFVSCEGFRFDFSHFGSISKEELVKVESRVNEMIKNKLKVDISQLPIEEAQKKGALMFFGEKYGDIVRMIKVGDFSVELCGGTHVKNTSEVQFFKIISESSISAGVRRIEAKASDAAKKYILQLGTAEWETNKENFVRYETLELKNEMLEGKPETYYQFYRITGDDVTSLKKALDNNNIILIDRYLEDYKKKNIGLLGRIAELEKEIEKESLVYVSQNLEAFEKANVDVKGSKVVRYEFKHYSGDLLRSISDVIKAKCGSCVSCVFSVHLNRIIIIISISDDLVAKGLDAGALVRNVSKILGGGGGGKKNMAEGGGKDQDKICDAFDQMVNEVKTKLCV